jgi:hypothetical protein
LHPTQFVRGAALSGLSLLALACPEPIELTQGDGSVDMTVSIADVVGVPNLDDDNGDGDPDWTDGDKSEDNDLATFQFAEGTFPTLRNGQTVQISLSDTELIRIWLDGEVVLGTDKDGETHGPMSVVEDPGALRVEFAEYLASGTVTVDLLGKDGEADQTVEVSLLASPLIVHNHTGIATHVWAVANLFRGANDALIAGYEDALGDRFTGSSGNTYEQDPWMQDEVEYASVSAPEGLAMEIVIDSIRDRGLATFAEAEVVGADSARGVWGVPEEVTSQDSFGNLEVTPPVTVDGVHYPFGRIYYGYPGELVGPDDWWIGEVHQDLREFFDTQVVQKPMQADVGFLCVGHVDEYISWVPDPMAPKGFWMLISDTVSAYEILESMDPDTRLPRYSANDGHGYSTVGGILADAGLRRDNEEIQEERLDAAVALFQREIGIDEGDIIRIPDIFEQVPGYGGCYAAMIPGMVNMIIANFGEGDDHLFMADPFVRTSLRDQSEDPFIAHMHDILPPQYELHFLDDWAAYHAGLGEVHCGTNVQREPAGDWWNSAAHLLEGVVP